MNLALSLSGGKDSVAASLHLRELGLDHVRIFMDTGWEHADLYAHLDYLERELGPVIRLAPKMPDIPAEILGRVEEIEHVVGRSPSGFVRWAVHKAMFPSRMRRYCTQELKVKPFLRWVNEQDDDIVNVVGIRAEESVARSKLTEREPMLGAEHVEVWRPLLKWTEADVIAIHGRHGVLPCPLYLRGSTRVGCWPCIQANKGELAALSTDDRRVQAIRMLEALVADLVRLRTDRSPPAMFQAPIAEMTADGPKYPCWPIDRVLEWSRTARGGRQMQLGGGWGQEAGCARWGLCEVAT